MSDLQPFWQRELTWGTTPAMDVVETDKACRRQPPMIRKLPSGRCRLYSRKTNPKTGKRRNLGMFSTRAAAEKHERAIQYFKRH